MPYLKYHLPELKKLSCPWGWSISEGIVKIPAWFSKPGVILPEMHKQGLSVDGTHEYLDELDEELNVSVFADPNIYFTQRCQAMLDKLVAGYYVWMLDADEFWMASQINRMLGMFNARPEKHCARFFMRVFVGPRLSLKVQPGAGNQSWDWFRVWRWTPGCKYIEHDPPKIMSAEWGMLNDRCFSRDETREAGLVPNHYAYCLFDQVRFKLRRYGESASIQGWEAMQKDKPPFDVYKYMPQLGHGEVELAPEECWLEHVLKQER